MIMRIMIFASLFVLATLGCADDPVGKDSILRSQLAIRTDLTTESEAIWLKDADFATSPTWSPETKKEPSIDRSEAIERAQQRLVELDLPKTQFVVTEISLRRFFDTDWWYYAITFRDRISLREEATIDPSPVTKKEMGAARTRQRAIGVVVLLSGEVLHQKQ